MNERVYLFLYWIVVSLMFWKVWDGLTRFINYLQN